MTFTTRQRRAIFRENSFASNTFCKALNDLRIWHDATLLCWILMPDHVHLLIQLGDNELLPKLVQRLKTNTSREVHLVLMEREPLWQRGYHDRALRNDKDVEIVARYVVKNSVRAELVERVGLYPYWNAVWI